ARRSSGRLPPPGWRRRPGCGRCRRRCARRRCTREARGAVRWVAWPAWAISKERCAVAPGQGEEDVTEIRDDTTIGAIFAAAISSHADRPFLAIPANAKRGYLPAGLKLTDAQAGRSVAELSQAYASAGYGLGHRVATLL